MCTDIPHNIQGFTSQSVGWKALTNAYRRLCVSLLRPAKRLCVYAPRLNDIHRLHRPTVCSENWNCFSTYLHYWPHADLWVTGYLHYWPHVDVGDWQSSLLTACWFWETGYLHYWPQADVDDCFLHWLGLHWLHCNGITELPSLWTDVEKKFVSTSVITQISGPKYIY